MADTSQQAREARRRDARRRPASGRGVGSGLGKTAGRGQKGQYARTRGVQAALRRRPDADRSVASRSAASTTRSRRSSPRSTSASSRSSTPARRSTRRALRERGLVKGRCDRIKILGDGELTKTVTVTAHAFSKARRGEDREGRRQGRPRRAAPRPQRSASDRATSDP